MEMAQQIPSVVKTGSNVFGTNRRPLGSAIKRQRARELASSQLSLFFDLEVLETLATIKPTIEKSDMEKVPSAPRIQHPVYNDVVTPQPSPWSTTWSARTGSARSRPGRTRTVMSPAGCRAARRSLCAPATAATTCSWPTEGG